MARSKRFSFTEIAFVLLLIVAGLIMLFAPVLHVNRMPTSTEPPQAQSRVPASCISNPDLTMEERVSAATTLEGFYRAQLNERGQAIYDALKEGLWNGEREIPLPSDAEPDEVSSLLELVMYDEPALFWFAGDGNIMTSGEVGMPADTQAFCPNYSMDPQRARKELLPIYENKAMELAEQKLPGSIWTLFMNDELSQCHAIMANIADETFADPGNSDNEQNIDSVFTQHQSVCSGYAKAFVMSARLLGFDCMYVHGTAANGDEPEEHGWVFIRVNGNVMVCDPTWFDSSVNGLYSEIWFCQAPDAPQFATTHTAVL